MLDRLEGCRRVHGRNSISKNVETPSAERSPALGRYRPLKDARLDSARRATSKSREKPLSRVALGDLGAILGLRQPAIDNDPRGRYRKLSWMKRKAKAMEPEKNVRLSEGLFAKVAIAARAENRTPDELLEAAAELYLKNRRWQKLLEFGEQNAHNLGLTAEDVPRLIAEARCEQKERDR